MLSLLNLRPPLAVGPVLLANRVVLAPMSGITDAPFRRLAASLGAGLVISEMTASQALVEERTPARLRAEAQGVGAHVVQLAGCEPRWMAEAARVVEASGAAVVDINMGCPARYVTGVQSGAALMRDVGNALRLIEATVAAVSIPVTVKMRLGWDAQSVNAPELARRAERAGVRLVTVHGRTRCQFYNGRADWTAVAAIKAAVRIPVVVNGDIDSCHSAEQALAASAADAVMIGRAARGRPWLPGQIARYLACGRREAAPPLETQFAIVDQLYEELLCHHGVATGIRVARKHLGWALDAAAATAGGSRIGGALARQRVLTGDDPRAVRQHLREAFADLAQGARLAA